MSGSIDYFFSTVSPFTYLGHGALLDIARRHGTAIRFRPFSIGGVWEKSGSVPLGQRSAIRQRYRLIELQRIAWQRGVKLNLKPAHFPVNPERADLCCAALALSGADAGGFAFAAGQGIWAGDLNIADENVLSGLLSAAGHDAASVLAASRGETAIASRAENTAAAIALNAIGAPAYVYKGEIFWGQDRLEMLDAMIASGREPFTAA